MRTQAWLLTPVMVAALIFAKWQLDKNLPESPDYPISRTINYTLTVSNPGHERVKEAIIWIYSPLTSDAYQILDEIQVSHPYRLDKDPIGNQRLVFEVKNLPPFARKKISVTAQLRLSTTPNRMPDIRGEDYLGEAPNVDVTDSNIQSLARRLEAEDPWKTAQNIYRWVVSNITRSGYQPDEQKLSQALQKKTRDCTDMMYLFSALSRANRIPSRNLAGFLVHENVQLKPQDYHNWSEVLIDGRWRLVDLDKRVFMRPGSHYVAMRVLDSANTDIERETFGLFGATGNIKLSMN
jgi:hypothetical protein